MIYSYSEILLCNKKNELLRRASLWVTLKNHYADRRDQAQKTVFCEMLYETVGKTNVIDRDRKQINSNLGPGPGVSVGGNELGRGTRASLGERNGPIS